MCTSIFFFFNIFIYILIKTIPGACANPLKSYLFGICDVDGIVTGCVIFVAVCGSYDYPYSLVSASFISYYLMHAAHPFP